MPKGIPKKPGEEQTLEGGGGGGGAGVRRGAYTTKKQQARIDAMTDEERAASMNVGKQFEILSPVAYPYVEPVKKKKGGLTASRRADGIASRGKTKGRMV